MSSTRDDCGPSSEIQKVSIESTQAGLLQASGTVAHEAEPQGTSGSAAGGTAQAEVPCIPEGKGGLEGGKDEDEDEDMEDLSSEVSEGVDLIDDLKRCLEGTFDFKGSFYYSGTFPSAPNPCLHVDGIGFVGLPLSERDAKAIISCSAQAPFGKGDQTVIDKAVRDTWEVEPSKVSFRNPAWLPWVNQMATTTVWNALGVAPASTPPRCDLYKLLLYEPGSHFLPHQDTQKADGMFATIVIVLPSPYEGGQVHVTHSGTTHVLDMSSTSMASTSILAWYTDVVHTVKPITSGYRLALSYNLIHTSPNVPRPTLPQMDGAVDELRQVLRKWKHQAYPTLPSSPPLVAYLLQHQYSQANLSSGIHALKGSDANKLAHLIPLAEELGFIVCLANLSCHMIGSADECVGYDNYYNKRNRYRWSGCYEDEEDEEEIPDMDEVEETTLELSHLVDIGGHHQFNARSILIDEDALIPRNPFEGLAPDEEDYEGYQGNWAGQVEHWYRRTVLVLFQEEDEFDIMFKAGGLDWGLLKLQGSVDPPSSEDRKVAAAMVRSLNVSSTSYPYNYGILTPNVPAAATTLLEYAIKWKDVDMWSEVVKGCGYSFSRLGLERVMGALKCFPFDSLKPSFEEAVKRTSKLQERLDLIKSIPAQDPHNIILHSWANQQYTQALASYNSALLEDIPSLIAIAKSSGLKNIYDIVLPNLVKKPQTYTFWVAFVNAVHESRDSFNQAQTEADAASVALPLPGLPPPGSSTGGTSVEAFIQKCLMAAVPQWDTVVAQPSRIYYSYGSAVSSTAKVDRIIELIELCFKTSVLKPCSSLFALVLKDNSNVQTKFTEIYVPLVARLRATLKKANKDISLPPFGDVFRGLVKAYLRIVLGTKSSAPRPNIRALGCGGCHECRTLDTFMNGAAKEQRFPARQQIRTHLEGRLRGASDLCKFHTEKAGTPHTLVVTKHQNVVDACTWGGRVKKAKEFLGSIGTSAELNKLLGEQQYQDTLRALQGTAQSPAVAVVGNATPAAAAGVRAGMAHASAVSGGHTQALAGPSGSLPTGAVHPQPLPSVPAPQHGTAAAVAGTKRKERPVVRGPVIDLTGLPP